MRWRKKICADLQAVVDALANGGYEVCGIEPEGFINSRLERPAYRVIVAKAVHKAREPLIK
jgi:archaeosine-15-forming tRNA-guanine transglycosylase